MKQLGVSLPSRLPQAGFPAALAIWLSSSSGVGQGTPAHKKAGNQAWVISSTNLLVPDT